jgi:hypothetical protein
MEQSSSSPRRMAPNPKCALLCPVLEADREVAGYGDPIADENFERHCAQSNECDGTKYGLVEGTVRVRCPLFGVDARL